MAAPVTTLQPPVLTTPVLIALVTLKGYSETKNHHRKLYIEDLAQYLVELERGGIDISKIALSRSLDKYWSEDIARFVSEGLVYGFLSHKSPLEFEDRCLVVCKRAIDSRLESDESLREVLRRAKKILALEELDV